MANWKRDDAYSVPQSRRYERIFCFTCEKDVIAKSLLAKYHQEHDVHYVDRDGNIDE